MRGWLDKRAGGGQVRRRMDALYEAVAGVHEAFPWFFTVLAAVFGAIVGSFLNVCIYRIPAGISVVTPGSRCACGEPIRWHDNIPVLGWFLLRGRARCCGRRIAGRYPAVEAATALLFALAWMRLPAGRAAAVMVLLALLIVATMVDLDHMIIPDRVSIGGMLAGMALSALVPQVHGLTGLGDPVAHVAGAMRGLLGVCVGSGVILWIGLLAEVALRREAIGFGDVKLMGAIGAFLGWQGAVAAIFGGALVGLAAVAGLQVAGRLVGNGETGESALLGREVPFGPMLAAGAVLYVLLGEPYVDEFLDVLAFFAGFGGAGGTGGGTLRGY